MTNLFRKYILLLHAIIFAGQVVCLAQNNPDSSNIRQHHIKEKGQLSKTNDSSNVAGKIAFDVMTWASFTLPFTYNSYRQEGVFTHAYKDVAYRVRVSYPIKKFRVGLDFSFKEIIKDEKLTHGIMTNGLQTINLTADYTFYEHNKLKFGGYFNYRIFHLKNNEDIQNDLAQLGIIGEYKLYSNISP